MLFDSEAWPHHSDNEWWILSLWVNPYHQQPMTNRWADIFTQLQKVIKFHKYQIVVGKTHEQERKKKRKEDGEFTCSLVAVGPGRICHLQPWLPCPGLCRYQFSWWRQLGLWKDGTHSSATPLPRVSWLFPHIHKSTPHHTNEDLIGISEGKLLMLNLSGAVISESLLSKATKDRGVNNWESS